MNITARIETLPDQDLLKEKGGRGFPYITLMTASGTVVWEFWPADGKAFDQAFEKATLLNSLMDKSMAAPDNNALAASVKILDNMGRSQRKASATPDELKTLAATEGLDPKVLELYKIDAKAKAAKKVWDDALKKAREDNGVAVLELFKKGTKIPEGMRSIGIYYWATKGGIAAKDIENANKALAAFEKAARDAKMMERAKGDIDTFRKEIDALTPAKK